MFSATAYVIRDARLADVPELVLLGWATNSDWPLGEILIGEIGGAVAAAFAIDENRSLAARIDRAPRLLAHMRAQAAGIVASRDAPAVSERVRERVRLSATLPVGGTAVAVEPDDVPRKAMAAA
ncbi:MAG: hypothetical protein QOK21_3467 [Solirubrobacteraceae bacterium]|nr:hypothetical protein [Solirubrobacteraceae bacterium]